jgi:16S rRNA C1402 (ribose-2'-O) methylase RsmI
LKNILELMQSLAPKRNIVLPFNLTLPDETVYSGTAGEILNALSQDNNEKGEFLLLIEGCR